MKKANALMFVCLLFVATATMAQAPAFVTGRPAHSQHACWWGETLLNTVIDFVIGAPATPQDPPNLPKAA